MASIPVDYGRLVERSLRPLVLYVGWLLPWEHYADSPADTTSGWNVDPWGTGQGNTATFAVR